MAEDSSRRDESFPVNYGRHVVESGEADGQVASHTLLFSEPARSSKFIFPVKTCCDVNDNAHDR